MSKKTILVIARCFDKTGQDVAQRRQSYLPEHLEHVKQNIETIFAAGPLYTYDNKTVLGSLYIYNTSDVNQAKEMLRADPYYKADIWGEIRFTPFYPAAGTSVGGLNF